MIDLAEALAVAFIAVRCVRQVPRFEAARYPVQDAHRNQEQPNPMRYQTIFITGIHTGLGKSLTQAFLDAGADVFAVSRRRPDDLNNSDRLRFCALDLSQTDQIRNGIHALIRRDW